MGREVRRVPPNWQHPKEKDSRTGKTEYIPLHDRDYETAMRDWLTAFRKWRAKNRKTKEPYREFCDYHGDPPKPKYYRNVWTEEATWYQVYETVSEGTPVTPSFATKEELVDHLVQYGDLWDQRRGHGGWDRNNAKAFVDAGFASSGIVTLTDKGADIKTPRDMEPNDFH